MGTKVESLLWKGYSEEESIGLHVHKPPKMSWRRFYSELKHVPPLESRLLSIYFSDTKSYTTRGLLRIMQTFNSLEDIKKAIQVTITTGSQHLDVDLNIHTAASLLKVHLQQKINKEVRSKLAKLGSEGSTKMYWQVLVSGLE